MSEKGTWVYLNRRKYTLLHGTRKATKSNTAQNCLAGHAFNYDGAVCAIIVKGLTMSASTGVWEELTGARGILETEWFKFSSDCRYTKTPRMMSDSKMRYCRLQTQDGGESEIQLHTIARSQDTEKRFKDSSFSFIYIVEADRWDTSEIFLNLIPQLRGRSVPSEQRSILLDCNPPRTGKDHWLYGQFIADKHGNKISDQDPDYLDVSFNLREDNPFISEKDKLDIYNSVKHNPVDLARNWNGEWVKSKVGTAFAEQFVEAEHVVGAVENNTILLPPVGNNQLHRGWDLGDSKNHAAAFACPVRTSDGTMVAYIIDEHVKTGVNSSTRSFTLRMMEKTAYWKSLMKARGAKEIESIDICDSSNLRYISAAGRSAAQEVLAASNQEMMLVGAQKGPGSVAVRVDYLRRLLFDRRIFVSSRCPQTIKMLNEIEADANGDISDNSPHKHIFDALTYLLPHIIPATQTVPDNARPPEAISV